VNLVTKFPGKVDATGPHMRKVRLSPVQTDILWMLEEAGSESLACIRATLNYTETDLDGAIAGLKRLGYVVDDVERDGRPALALTEAGRMALTV
jgi:DNA-binding MarR family transcriptional regulator